MTFQHILKRNLVLDKGN